MVKRAKARLVEGPICESCGGALSIKEERRQSEGGVITYVHRDNISSSHAPHPVWKVIRP